MLKKIIALIVCSIAVVVFMSYAHQGMQLLLSAHEWVSHLLMDVFAGGQAGKIARELIALLSIPIFLGLVPTLIYWAIRRSWLPWFMDIVWVIWLIQAGAIVMTYHAS